MKDKKNTVREVFGVDSQAILMFHYSDKFELIQKLDLSGKYPLDVDVVRLPGSSGECASHLWCSRKIGADLK